MSGPPALVKCVGGPVFRAALRSPPRTSVPPPGYAKNQQHDHEDARAEWMLIELHHEIATRADYLRHIQVFEKFHRLICFWS